MIMRSTYERDDERGMMAMEQTKEVVLHVTYDPEDFELDWTGLGRDNGIHIFVVKERVLSVNVGQQPAQGPPLD